MKEIRILQKLDRAAGEVPPADVTDRVMQSIRNESGPLPMLAAPPSLWLAAGVSWAAAAAALFFALQSLTQLQDPFADLLNPLSMGLR